MEIRNVASSMPQPPQATAVAAGNTSRSTGATPLGGTGETPGMTNTPAAQPTTDQVQQAIDQVQQIVRPLAQSLQFSIDKDTHGTVVKIVDTETNKVIRQIPSEEMLQMAKALDKFTGLLMKQTA
ncbi:MAG: flagellar protein FlaG [Zoogloea sp.]|jgi:flagellar protein FlaG|uniref:flagellar protein FlaG n=1 Tax=Zoogloea sp. TaxID=49181 RepID=UPI00262538E9|nr:flagellar protein FlaG [Zoogloea sp.]MDD3328274.1 flagellar protein FlaG [Zoogloea sp.]